jgi:cysteine desulfurase
MRVKMLKRVYLDYNATAPPLPAYLEGISHTMQMALGNSSSVHHWGQNTRRLLERARKTLAESIEAHPDHVVFTSGGTEGNNHLLRGAPWHVVLMDPTAHDSAFKALEKGEMLKVSESGVIDLAHLEKKLSTCADQGLVLISVNSPNNETGVIQPLEDIVRLAHAYDHVFVHVDASQALGKVPLSFSKLAIDAMTLCAHKMGGPQGIGALVLRETISLQSLMRGGGQEKSRRSGTENIMAICGWQAALENMPDLQHLRKWHDHLETVLRTAAPESVVVGGQAPRVCNTTNITMPGVPNHTQVMSLDLAGFAVSAGSACSSGKVSISRVIKAMIPQDSVAETALRISSGWQTTQSDLDHFSKAWIQLFNQTRQNK